MEWRGWTVTHDSHTVRFGNGEQDWVRLRGTEPISNVALGPYNMLIVAKGDDRHFFYDDCREDENGPVFHYRTGQADDPALTELLIE